MSNARNLADLLDANGDVKATSLDNTSLGGLTDANTTATSNLGLGTGAVDSITTGDYNVGVGDYALDACTEGVRNTAAGYAALFLNTTGYDNVAVGRTALYSNTSGYSNTAAGKNALYNNTTGNHNVAIGTQAAQSSTTGGYNTSVGYQALYSNTTGQYNVAVGRTALHGMTTGQRNTAVGHEAGVTTTTGHYNTMLGFYARGSAAAANYENVLGYYVVGAGAYHTTVGIDTNKSWLLQGATSWSGSSDLRLKDNIKTSTAGLSFINDLRPVTFEWKAKGDVPIDLDHYKENSTERVNGNDKVNHGFIAQEVKAAIDAHPEIASGHGMWNELADGSQGVAQGNLVPMLVKAIQELSAKVEALENA